MNKSPKKANFAYQMIDKSIDNRPRLTEILIHVIGWGIVFGFPFLMISRSGSFSWMDYLRRGCIMPLSMLLVFYANYCRFVPRLLFKQKISQYLLINLLIIVVIAAIGHCWQEYLLKDVVLERPDDRHMGPPKWVFFMRDACSMALIAALGAAIRLSSRWKEVEDARRNAEQSRTEAELKNLRNQLNPHFLLNTLNNIYALIAFDTEKAQTAVQELSRLLRHVLYDNQQNFVTLDKEMEFIRNYIELMRIRLSAHVKVETIFDIRPDSKTEIAPLIFISLIENAFKHGISPTEPSFIHIRFTEDDRSIVCEIENSYHPKSRTDKSGSGIGLKQVEKRLELTYPGHYQWQQGVSKNGKSYKSLLIIEKREAASS